MKKQLIQRVREAVMKGRLDTFEERTLFCMNFFAEACQRFPKNSNSFKHGFQEIQKDMERARKVFQFQRVADNFCQAPVYALNSKAS